MRWRGHHTPIPAAHRSGAEASLPVRRSICLMYSDRAVLSAVAAEASVDWTLRGGSILQLGPYSA